MNAEPRSAGRVSPHWTACFGRSRLGSGVYAVRWYVKVYPRMFYNQPVPARCCWDAIVKACRRLGVPGREEYVAHIGGGAEAFYADYVLLDGGVSSRDGFWFCGRNGAWVFGRRTLRFLCYELGIPQPPRWRGEVRVPLYEELLADAFRQLEEMETLKSRLEQYTADYH